MPIKNIVTGQKVTKEKPERAKELRREITPAEKLLWQEVRAKKLGVRFRPPPPSAPPPNSTGGVYVPSQILASNLGEEGGGELGLRIVRFRNDEVVMDLSTVLEKIKKKLN